MNCRCAVAAVLLVLVALDLLPCSCRETQPAISRGGWGFACSFEPLQVCCHDDSLSGTPANTPFVVPGTPAFIFVPEVRHSICDLITLLPDGFTPEIDRPPRAPAPPRSHR